MHEPTQPPGHVGPRLRRGWRRLAGVAAFTAFVAVMPLVASNNYQIAVLTFVAINTILCVGLNLLMGYAGQISLGHGAFFGLGAYASAVLTTQHHWSPWPAMCAGLVLTCAVAYLIGMPCLRLKGHYLAMATLGVGWIANTVMQHWVPVTHGTSGVEGIPKLTVGPWLIDTDRSRYLLAWAVAIALLALTGNLVDSRVGRSIRALNSSERAAAAMGIDVARVKVVVFVWSAAFASVAGSLYAHTVGFISPSAFGFMLSVEMVVMVVVGGMASVWGAVVGATSITLLVEWLRGLGQAFPRLQNLDIIAHGAILMLGMLFVPEGLFVAGTGVARRLVRRWARLGAGPAIVGRAGADGGDAP